MSALPEIKMPIVPIVSLEDRRQIALPSAPVEKATRLGRIWAALLLWQQKREGRRALRELTAAGLKDIGVSQSDAAREVGKSFFWD
ncbi:hypothetical protein RLEG12_21015 [Rhizobium leguminosarum bv. trifolii CB782]|uniref:DUF1127 domain-containing protein n=1 Tax=Rhizobium hidalgonense TaxID=1538159 RepID=A0A2A6KKV3_9HYPH|nr:DUF1127 domain-containing protein [Rhizobium hidalgonense]AHG45559.1 hypothetical protein RLEG12_21015 [Rhizobium leguminosarum bv. trifolii CB782]EJC73388.1 uncharacterized conserved small protein [Rhizobium leguminosarum bv. trifolii WSM2012]MDR9771309.1 DUF1127 domain-containing protein [Rhizobium hidalgonense]MDR9803643.1 DUF1127 domain-containing protein [Rhizobium hidalgonense]MDR9809136.1 DUF1127 domain-containing protein [Rhizobium hidalgonense]